MSLDGVEVVRRFLLHVLPKGCVRIRHFGVLANRARKEKLARVQAPLASERAPRTERDDASPPTSANDSPAASDRCPRCELGYMNGVERILPRNGLVHDTW